MRQQPTTADAGPLDRIEKSIDIDASAEKVFGLVCQPGWWINDGTIDSAPTLRQEGAVTVLTHAEYGEFRLATVACEPLSYVAFRWHHPVPEDGRQRSTLVEFRIEPRDGGGVILSVVESGFSGLHKPRQEWLQDRSDNVEGWDTELTAARTYLEAT